MESTAAGSEHGLVLTIGHSNRSIAEFVVLLRAHAITILADVRFRPHSRRHPHFSIPALPQALAAAKVAYHHLPALGGMREPRPGSSNTALGADAFRGYADHMQGAPFARGVDELLALAAAGRVAAMCAEAAPEQCHRSFLADALLVRGVRVEHVIDAGAGRPHTLHPLARVEGDLLVYDGSQERLALD